MRYKKRSKKPLIMYFTCLFFIITFVFIIALSNSKEITVASNINTVRSITSSIVYNKQEIVNIRKKNKISDNLLEKNVFFYNKDINDLSCPYDISKIDDVYYNDEKFGLIRIIAMDSDISCGSIVYMSNYDNEEFYGIVLDHIDNLNIGIINNKKNDDTNNNLLNKIKYKIVK